MDRLNISIQEADNISLRNGAANRIVQLLQKQRYSNNENSAKRWVWELCQNAKDVCNNTGKVKIGIEFNEETNKVLFKHNGKAFSMSNVLSLINQSSSKDRNNENERKSGKFGTGFITTHLLSEVVNISGVLENISGYSKFNITLDRTGNQKNEIIESMERAVSDLHNCTPIEFFDLDSDEYYTKFEYKLDEYSINVARDGLENLRISAPFVLAMLHDIEEILIENTGEKYCFYRDISCNLENSVVSEIKYEANSNCQSIFVLKLSQDNVSILIAFEYKDGNTKILPFSDQQSKLFCDFPLIGTEDFPFPVLISSQDFNPTEPRDGVFLICKNKSRNDIEIEMNRHIIETAGELYQKLLEYVSENNWDGIYNITKIGTYDKKDWYDKEWIEGIVECNKDVILHTPIINTENDSMVELLDLFDDEQVFIISDRREEIRIKIWEFLKHIMPDRIPRKEDLHEWYHSLWGSCNRYTFRSLTKQINDYGDLNMISGKLINIEYKEWLEKYFDMIDENDEWQEYIGSKAINILPNQNGKFCAIGDLYFDSDILDQYKNILADLGNDSKEWLLHLEFKYREWFKMEKFYNKNVLELIEKSVDEADKEIKGNVFEKIIFMYDKKYSNLLVQKKICSYATEILGIEMKMVEVSVISEELLQDALKYIVTRVADFISECNTVDGLAINMNITKEETIRYIAEFVEFIVKQGYDNLINKATKPILPNQNGVFTTKEELFIDCEMDVSVK